jgi:hypothetical protein
VVSDLGSETPVAKRRRRIEVVMVGALVTLALVFSWVGNRHEAIPEIVEGWAMPNASGSAISLHRSDAELNGNGFIVAGARWVGPDNVWHDGGSLPTCIGTDTASLTPVRLGIVHVESENASWQHVVWLRCLSSPVH